MIHAKVAKEHYEEQLKSEVNFLKSQLLGEQQSKESIEDQLTAEIEALREKVTQLILLFKTFLLGEFSHFQIRLIIASGYYETIECLIESHIR